MSHSEQQSDEEKIIATLVIEGARNLYDDSDFLPIRQSLYNFESIVPLYDDNIGASIQWIRPHLISEDPDYFNSSGIISVRQGTLPDELFLGALMAIAVYPKQDLLENIIASRPEDFKRFGIFTCRFYVEGDWVEVITDTAIPCVRNNLSNAVTPAYSRSSDCNEMWVSFIQKAYAKAVGSYEAIQKVKLHEALMHLTGGSVQQVNIQDDYSQSGATATWNSFKTHVSGDTVVLAMPYFAKQEQQSVELTGTSVDDGDSLSGPVNNLSIQGPGTKGATKARFLPNRLYSVVMTREDAELELVLLHNPWGESPWQGEWSETSGDWDMYPELLKSIESDPLIPWTRLKTNGYFWMSMKNFQLHFNSVYYCKLFPRDKYKFYCVRDEWKGKQAGGPLNTIRDKSIVANDYEVSKGLASKKISIPTVIDGDYAWFNNPKVRLHCQRMTTACISLVPLSGDKEGGGHMAGFTVVSTPKVNQAGVNQLSVWDACICDIVTTDHIDALGKAKGQEVSVWDLKMSPKNYYYLIPNTVKRGQEGTFILRVFASDAVLVEKVPTPFSHSISSEWNRVGDTDTTGGPYHLMQDGVSKENSKWCQNPQFYIELKDPIGVDEVHVKVVLRRTDKSATSHKSGLAATGEAVKETTVGLLVCKADAEVEANVKNARKKKAGPRQNAMGEVQHMTDSNIIPSKESTLKRRSMDRLEETKNDPALAKQKVILRKMALADDLHYFESTYTSRTDACVYFPKLPRAWNPQGFIISPSLSDKGVKGNFDLDIYSSEPFTVKQLPITYSRAIAAEWTESTSCGCHMNSQWRKNPKFTFKFRQMPNEDLSIPVKITLGRHGLNWKGMCKRDPIGTMIGFYVFIQRQGELHQIYESAFVPGNEVITDPSFALEPLRLNEEYVIMPATFNEGKAGSFIVSITTSAEFIFNKEK